MRWFPKFENKGLVVRMTLWVSCSVVLVSLLILLGASTFLSLQYENLVRDALARDAETTTQLLKQRMSRVCYATQTAALMAGKDAWHMDGIDSVLVHSLKGMQCVDATMAIYRENFFPDKTIDSLYLRGAYFADSARTVATCREDSIANLGDDENWNDSYGKGKPCMSAPYDEDLTGKMERMVCYSVPLTAPDGDRYGIFCSCIKIFWLTDIVVKNKVRPEFDVSIYYRPTGECVVEPSEAFRKLQAEGSDKLIVEKRYLPELDWDIYVEAPESLVDDCVYNLVREMALIMLVLLLVVTLAVVLVVRFIGQPFALEQQSMVAAKAVMDNEMQMAARTQNDLVPHVFPPFPHRPEIDLHACLHPAREVGGDLYDYFLEDDSLYFCIGDVSGKGVNASLFMAATRYLFRSVAANAPLSDAVAQMNRSLCIDNTQCMFVTFWFGCLNLRSGRLEYVNAGHNAPILVHEGRADFMPQPQSMPLGVWEDADYASATTTLADGDVLLLYTDGITEAMNADGLELGNAATLSTLQNIGTEASFAIIATLLQRVRLHAGDTPQSDDITVLCIKKLKGED